MYFLPQLSLKVLNISELVEKLVLNGLDEGDSHLLTSGLLLARQASLEGPHLFPLYDHWVQVGRG